MQQRQAVAPPVRWLGLGLLAVLCLMYFSGQGGRTTTGPSVPVQPAPTVRPAEAAVTLRGSGRQDTAPFDLAGGDYTLAWSATSRTGAACYHGAGLHRADGGQLRADSTLDYQQFGPGMLTSPASGETRAYRLLPGRYYLTMYSTCDWTVTVGQLR